MQDACSTIDDFVRCIAALKFEGALTPHTPNCAIGMIARMLLLFGAESDDSSHGGD